MRRGVRRRAGLVALFGAAFWAAAMPVVAMAGTAGLAQANANPANLRYIFAAFLAAWAGFFLYALFMARRERQLKREVEELRRQMEERKGKQG